MSTDTANIAKQNTDAGPDSQAVKPVGDDQFAGQRDPTELPDQDLAKVAGGEDMAMEENSPGRRMSREWDASKVPPSQFQKRKGSIYSTPNSRDGRIQGSDRDKAYFDKLKEKGWNLLKGSK